MFRYSVAGIKDVMQLFDISIALIINKFADKGC